MPHVRRSHQSKRSTKIKIMIKWWDWVGKKGDHLLCLSPKLGSHCLPWGRPQVGWWGQGDIGCACCWARCVFEYEWKAPRSKRWSILSSCSKSRWSSRQFRWESELLQDMLPNYLYKFYRWRKNDITAWIQVLVLVVRVTWWRYLPKIILRKFLSYINKGKGWEGEKRRDKRSGYVPSTGNMPP